MDGAVAGGRSGTICAVVLAVLATPSHARAEDVSMCSTPNTEPVASCFEWLTGPASTDNATVQKKYWGGGLVDRTLFSTDQGWPVTDPSGTKLELMVFGDTTVKNPDLWPEVVAFTACLSLPEEDVCCEEDSCPGKGDTFCHTAFVLDPGEWEAGGAEAAAAERRCRYISATKRSLPAFYAWTNAVFYDAWTSSTKLHRIALGDNLYMKNVVVSTSEEDASSCLAIKGTGVYTRDYFYACPGSSITCSDTVKKLYFIAGPVSWSSDLGTWACAKRTLETDGAGIYEFGALTSKHDLASHGCRLAFAPNPPIDGRLWSPFCGGWPAAWVQPAAPHNLPLGGSPTVVSRTANHAVLWGYGSRFHAPVVLHKFLDWRDPNAYPRQPGGTRYVYFLGSGEKVRSYDASLPGWNDTGLVYMARVPAYETALKRGAFQYFRGFESGTGSTLWGSYSSAVDVLDLSAFQGARLASVIEKGGTYYLAVTIGYDGMGERFHGMIVLSCSDGFDWSEPEYVAYSNIADELDAEAPASSAWLVYGHYWVPSVVFNDPTRIPYVFSVWKQYLGFHDDFFLASDPRRFPISDAERFREYNTKMYWYRL
jgi:hypothetical protein